LRLSGSASCRPAVSRWQQNQASQTLYAKMVAGYTPGVPVLGTVSAIGAAILRGGGYGLILGSRRARQSVSE